MHNFKTFILLGAIALMSIGSLSACNTIAGFGKDVERTGDAIEDTAEGR